MIYMLIWNDYNQRAINSIDNGDLLPKSWSVATIIVLLWLIIIAVAGTWIIQKLF